LKKLVFFLLLFLPLLTKAEWVLIGSMEKQDHYFDPGTLNKKGSLVNVLEMVSFKQGNAFLDGSKSLVSKNIFDCNKKTFKFSSIVTYTDYMQTGNVLHSANYDLNSQKATAISPGTTKAILLNELCK